MKLKLIAYLFSSLLVVSASAALGETGFCADREAGMEGDGSHPMATLGGVHESRGAENSVEVETLGRFAVDEHNNKESDYLGKISLKMSTMEAKSQSTIPNVLPSNSAGNNMSIDSSAQAGHSGGGDWQEEAYQKVKSLGEAYLPELNEVHQKVCMKLQQHESLPRPKSDQLEKLLEKLKAFKLMLERAIAVLQVSKADIVPGFKEKLVLYEEQLINFRNTIRRYKASMQQKELPPPHMQQQPQQQSQPQTTGVQSHENRMNPQLRSRI